MRYLDIDGIIERWISGKIDIDKARMLFLLEKRKRLESLKENEWAETSSPFPESPAWNDVMIARAKCESARRDIAHIEGALDLLPKDKAPDASAACPPIVWKGSLADLARIYKDLLNNNLIDIKGRDFSLHFLDRKGNALHPDFLESCGTKQNAISSKQGVQGLQQGIRGMKPESGE